MNRYAYCGGNPIQMIDPSGYMSCSQTDNLLLGIGASVSDSVKDLLNTFKKDSLLAIGELAKAVWNGQLSVKDLAAAMGQSIIQPYGYVKNNFDDIFQADPSDREVFEYGRNVGQCLQDIAGLFGGAAIGKSLLKCCPKLTKLLGSLRFRGIDEGLNFTETAAKRMEQSGRFVPVQILQRVIKSTKGVRDPQGSKALMHYSTMYLNGQKYNLEVLYDARSNTVLHFMYTRDSIGGLPAIPKGGK